MGGRRGGSHSLGSLFLAPGVPDSYLGIGGVWGLPSPVEVQCSELTHNPPTPRFKAHAIAQPACSGSGDRSSTWPIAWRNAASTPSPGRRERRRGRAGGRCGERARGIGSCGARRKEGTRQPPPMLCIQQHPPLPHFRPESAEQTRHGAVIRPLLSRISLSICGQAKSAQLWTGGRLAAA